MVRYILQTTGAFVTGPGNLNPASTPTLKLATQEPLSVTYLNAAGQPVLLTGDYLPYLGVKPQSDYDAPFVALSTILSAPSAGSFAYTGTLNCNTTEFYAALGDTAGSMTAEADTVALMGEVVVQVDADGNLARSQTFSITGQNRVVTGSEGVPVSANPAYPSAAAVIAAVAQAATIRSVSSRPATVYVDAANGSDTAGNLRGTSAAYASFAAALAASQANDTIYVRGGSSPALTGTINFAKDMTIRGDGRFQSVFAVDNTTSVQFAPGVAVSVLDLGFAGSAPATASNGILLQLNQSKGVEVSRCAFTNLNQFAIGGYSVYRMRIRDNYISHCGGGILIDDLPAAQLATGNYNFSNVDLTIEDNHIEWTVDNGIVLHNINAYNAEDAADAHIGSAKFATNLRLIGNTVRYASMGLQTGGPQLAYEVWHGWSNGLIADNLAEDSYFGYSFDRVNNTCISNNRSVHCSFLYEFNTCTDLALDNNMADARPSAGSPFIGLGPLGTVVFDGGTMNCHWRGGVLTATSMQFGFDPVQHCSVTGASFSSSYVFVQHATDIAVTDNFFAPTPGAAAAGSWLIIDMGGEAIGPVTFSRNTIRGGANGYGITILNPGTISCLALEDNVSDGTGTASGCCPNAQLHTIALSHVWRGNRGFPAENNPLPNDDDPATQPTLAALTFASATTLDFAGAAYQTLAMSGGVTFTTANLAAGRSIVAILSNATSAAVNLGWSPAWIALGAPLPSSLAAGKTAALTLTCTGTTDVGILADYSAQP